MSGQQFCTILLVFLSLTVIAKAQSPSQIEGITIPLSGINKDTTSCNAGANCWDVLRFPKADPSQYRLLIENGDTLILASSDDQASGLVYRTSIDPSEYPVLEWAWKTEDIIKEGNMMTKEGDDYPARIFVTFSYDKKDLPIRQRIKRGLIKTFTAYDVPTRALNYVWSSGHPVGTTTQNAFTEWVVMISVQSGEDRTEEWVQHRVNLFEDYKKAFGEAPGKITGIAIMTDTDNTGAKAETRYKQIRFLPLQN